MPKHSNAGRLGRIGFALIAFVCGGLVAAGSVHAQTGASADSVTFTKDIAPILQRSCQNCHQP